MISFFFFKHYYLFLDDEMLMSDNMNSILKGGLIHFQNITPIVSQPPLKRIALSARIDNFPYAI